MKNPLIEIGVKACSSKETYKYCIIEPSIFKEGSGYKVEKLVEKPDPGTAPSILAIMGRYILTPEIFMFLKISCQGQEGKYNLQMLYKT